ncbi:flagellar motor stator protein MotA [Rhodovibrionaceae bacterium A322]
MLAIGGVVIVFAMVFGGYLAAGGSMAVIIYALPFEMMMIGGAAVGAMLIGNGMDAVKAGLAGFGRAVKGPKWNKDDYQDILCLMYMLTKTMKSKGVVGLEPHIENPEESSIFSQFEKIQGDHHVVHLICDTLRMVTMNLDDPHQVEDYLERQIEKHHHEEEQAHGVLSNMADGLPALGIVAAVLGIVKTMSAIDQPVEILGNMIGGALVGTFLGVFLAYGLVGPFGQRFGQVQATDAQFMLVIRDVLVAHLHGHAAQVSVEIGRGNVPTNMQPSFYDLEEAINNMPEAA